MSSIQDETAFSRLRSELSGAIVKRLLHSKNQFSVPDSFFIQFVTEIKIYIYKFVYRTIKRYNDTGSVSDKPRSSRPAVTTTRIKI